MYKLKNIYFLNNNIEKLNLINDIVKKWDYIIFDTETNGLNHFWESLPFQIAAIKYRKWVEIDRINIIVNLGVKIDDEILELTSFKQSDIDNWISPKEAIKLFNNFVYWEKYIIAHNASFDVSIINNLMVATNTYISKSIDVYCSMQMYYTIYKHIFWLWISWSNLDQLSNILLWEPYDDTKRHQADYDILLTKKLLDKIKLDIDFDLSKWDNSEIKKVSQIEENINKKIEYIKNFPKDKKTMDFLNDVWVKINNLYNNYYEKYHIPNIIIANTITKFLQEKTWLEYPEIYLRNEKNNITYYIKKRQIYEDIDKKYLNKWSKIEKKYYTNKWYEISFFIFDNDYNLFSDDVVINNEETLNYFLKKYIEQKNNMMKIQREIQYLLKIIKEHKKTSTLSYYWKWNKWINIKTNRVNWYNEKFLDIIEINNDIKKWLVKNINDLMSYPDYNTALLVEENLCNKIKNI